VFSKVLVANRGEIAVRVIRTLRELGITSVAVYSDADESAPHVTAADEALWIGKAPASDSYLNIDRIVAAATAAGAQAVHPGYGFLAENARFARACAAAGLTFVGPPPSAIEAMGDKIAAKATVAAAGVPVVPGAGGRGMTDEELIGGINEAWFPVLVKPSAGGGGKGMRVAGTPGELPLALAAARREALASFGDDTLLIEQYVARPRHIEIQVLADTHGTVLHLGERECSLQRRHQKIIEEAPSPFIDDAHREAMGAAAAAAARSVGYTGAGTIELIVSGDDPGRFYFMEMNTRLQVEHPVTELVYGLDLVEWQLRVAAGERLSVRCHRRGHAMEARVYAEDPGRGFLPTGGTVLALRPPAGRGVRVDSGLALGMAVTSAYDPMLGKVIAWGPDRATALRRLDAALGSTVVLGVTTNVAFLRELLRDPDVQAGRLDTGLVERLSLESPGVPDEVLAAAGLACSLSLEPAGSPGGTGIDPWDIPDGWRPGGRVPIRLRLDCFPREPADVSVWGRARLGAEVSVDGGTRVAARAAVADGEATLLVTYGGVKVSYAYAWQDDRTLWLGRDGQTWIVRQEDPAAARLHGAGTGDGVVRSPMPGTVIAVSVSLGQRVSSGEPLLTVEAMKMEHTLAAPFDGVVSELAVKAGQQVSLDEPLVTVEQALLRHVAGIRPAAPTKRVGPRLGRRGGRGRRAGGRPWSTERA
jgi:acetyl-CoA/propionyl-CoA carboxylase biotin carboxyl carrier protein